MKKPIDKKTHGIVDYALAGVQIFVPKLLNMNKAAINTYTSMGLEVLAVNAMTKSPVGLFNRLSYKDHKKADIGFLAGLATLTAAKMIFKDKRALGFHLGLLALAAAHYMLTDYEE